MLHNLGKYYGKILSPA